MKKVVTVCPYCASGCKINLVVDNGKIVRAEAAQGKTNLSACLAIINKGMQGSGLGQNNLMALLL